MFNQKQLTLLIREIELDRIKSIDLSNHQIGLDGTIALVTALQTNTSVTNINLARSKIGADGARALAAMLKTNTSLTFINLYGNNIGGDGARALAAALQTNAKLTSIDLGDNNIGGDGARALAAVLQTNANLTSIDLGDNNIGDDGAEALAATLQKNTSVTSIKLHRNNIGAAGVAALAAALQTNSSVTSIDLSCNNIDDDGAKTLAAALKTNTSLTSITLIDNNIGDDGAKALAATLETNTNLTSINLYRNNIGNDGAKAFLGALRTNPDLTLVYLYANNIDDYQQISRLEGRNKLLSLMPYTTANTKKNRTNLLVPPFFSFKKVPENTDPIEFELNDVKKPCLALLELRANINAWLSSKPAPDADDIRNVDATYMANIAYVHLRGVSLHSDTTPITNLNRNVLAAGAAIAAIPKEHNLYKILCLHLGMYYRSRAIESDPKNPAEEKMQQAFAKSALNYLNVVFQDSDFSKKENVIGELPMLIAQLIHLVVPGKNDGFTQKIESIDGSSDEDCMKLINDPAWKTALATIIADERKPSELQLTNANSIDAKLKKTLETATFYYFNRFLEEEAKNSKNPSSLGMFSSASSTDSPPVALSEAINALKDACNGGQVDPASLKGHIEKIKKSDHCQRIDKFISRHPVCIHGNTVSTFDQLVTTLIAKPSLAASSRKV